MNKFSYLGIISDTHGDVETTSRAFDLFEKWGVERIVHCGDVGNPKILDVFRRIPTDFVLGNCDSPFRKELEEGIPKVGGRFFGANGSQIWRGKRIFWTHGNAPNRVEDETFSEEWDLICYGHTHIFQKDQYKNTIILNPGAIQSRSEYPSCCVVDAELHVERLAVSNWPFFQ